MDIYSKKDDKKDEKKDDKKDDKKDAKKEEPWVTHTMAATFCQTGTLKKTCSWLDTHLLKIL